MAVECLCTRHGKTYTIIIYYNSWNWCIHCESVQVAEVKHYTIGLTNMSSRGVIWKVNMAYDVLYNEHNNSIIHDYNNSGYICYIIYMQAMVHLLDYMDQLLNVIKKKPYLNKYTWISQRTFDTFRVHVQNSSRVLLKSICWWKHSGNVNVEFRVHYPVYTHILTGFDMHGYIMRFIISSVQCVHVSHSTAGTDRHTWYRSMYTGWGIRHNATCTCTWFPYWNSPYRKSLLYLLRDVVILLFSGFSSLTIFPWWKVFYEWEVFSLGLATYPKTVCSLVHNYACSHVPTGCMWCCFIYYFVRM